MSSIRQGRLNHQLQQEIAAIIQRELKDPALGFVTITKVDVTADLSYAKVGYSCLGGEKEQAGSQDALDRASGFIRSLLRKRFHLKMIPELSFRYDPSIAQSIEMSAKLDQLNSSS